MNDDFRSKLREVAKSTDEAAENAINVHQQSARAEYGRLKDALLKYASTNGYTVENGKKVITYYYRPIAPETRMSHSTAMHSTKKVFRTTYTTFIAYGPKDSESWGIFINEIIRLASADGISVTPVLYQQSKKLEAPFPLSTCRQEWLIPFDDMLRLKCVTEIDNHN